MDRLKQYLQYSSIAIIAMVSVYALCVATPAAALFQDITDQTDALAGDEGAAFTVQDDPRLVAARTIQVIVSLLGFAFLFYTIYGGGMIAFSQGNEDDIRRGKSSIVTGTIGIAIALMAYAITQFVSDAILQATKTGGCDPEDQWCVDVLPEDQNNDPLAPPRDDGSQAENFWNAVF